MILSKLKHSVLFCLVLLFSFYNDLFSQNIQRNDKESASFQKAIGYLHKGQEFGLKKNFDSAKYYINKGKRIAKLNDDNELKAYANLHSSRLAYWEGDIKLAKQLLENNKKTHLHDSIQILTNILFGEIFDYEKKYTEVIPYFNKAKKELLKLPFLTKKDSSLMRQCYATIGFVHEDLQNLEKARYYLTKALDFVHDSNDESYFLFRISSLYKKDKHVTKELKYLEKATAIAENNKWQLMLPTYYSSLSDYYIQVKKADSAIYYADKGLHNNTYCRLNWLNAHKGEAYFLKKDYHNATFFFTKALEYTTPEETLDVYKKLRELYTETKHYELALENNSKFLKLKDSLDNLKVKQEIFEISEKYESKNKEVTIQKQAKRLSVYSIGFIIALLIISVLTFFYRKQKKQKHLLFLKNHTLAQKLQKETLAAYPKATAPIEGEKINEIDKSILDLIDSEFYLSKDITLVIMAKLANTNTTYLSKVINEKYNKSFSTFINDLRISYTLKQLEAVPKYRKLTIAHISDKAGFSSHSTFYSAFKKFTGLTPSYYIKKHIKKDK